MADLTTINAVLSSIKSATDIAKIIRESEKNLEQAERKSQLADLMSALADAKIEAAAIQDELLKKDSLIKELQEALKLKGQIKWSPPYYYVEENGPYCQNCYDQSEKLIRLQNTDKGRWVCFACDKIYRDGDYEPPKPLSVRLY